jgi:hypothetical protein
MKYFLTCLVELSFLVMMFGTAYLALVVFS